MNITPLKLFSANNSSETKANNGFQFFGLKLSKPISKDTISFSGRVKNSFTTRKEALEYYKKIGESVNASLKEDDDLTAFETLGYDIDLDFDTEKITIKGDFKPYFTPFIKGQMGASISYEDVGISQDELLKNVETITGKKHLSPSFVPDENFQINTSEAYPEKLGEKLEKIVEQRAEKAKKALGEGEDEKALNILGFETETNEDGTITIKGDYDSRLLSLKNKVFNLSSYKIDENTLLRNVSRIEGSAKFSDDFSPTHYIEAGNYEYRSPNYVSYSKKRQLVGEFLRLHPSFIEQKEKIQTAIQNEDIITALNLMGFKASKNENGKIEIDGDFMFDFPVQIGSNETSIDFSEVGANKKEIFENIQKISGSLYYPDAVTPKIQGGMEIDKYVLLNKRTNEEDFFEEYISSKNITELYEGIPNEVIRNFAQNGFIKPSIKTRDNIYFNSISGENKAFLDAIMQHRDEILTSKELQEKYGVSKVSIDHAVQNGLLKGYLFEDKATNRNDNSNNYLFDITDERNKEGLSRLEKTGKRREMARARASIVPTNDFERACLRNSVHLSNQTSTFSFPASDLEQLGYGTKADLIANCGLRINSYEIKQYILNNDSYNINKPYIMDILLASKHNNPSIVSLKDLQKKLGESKEEFREAVVQDKLNIITDNPYRLTYPEDYCLDVSDKKNLEFLRTIDNEEFQTWLSGILESKKDYTLRNNEAMEAFKETKAPTQLEQRKNLEAEFRELEIERKKAQESKRLEIKERKFEQKRRLSLRNTIAWVLCPQTKQVKREHSNEKVQEIIEKHKEAKEISEQLLAGEITLEEAKEKIKSLNLSQNDEITLLAYHKTCWDISGTQEWKQALSDAKAIMEIYEKEGLDGIDDPEIRQRLVKWENNWAKNQH